MGKVFVVVVVMGVMLVYVPVCGVTKRCGEFVYKFEIRRSLYRKGLKQIRLNALILLDFELVWFRLDILSIDIYTWGFVVPISKTPSIFLL